MQQNSKEQQKKNMHNSNTKIGQRQGKTPQRENPTRFFFYQIFIDCSTEVQSTIHQSDWTIQGQSWIILDLHDMKLPNHYYKNIYIIVMRHCYHLNVQYHYHKSLHYHKITSHHCHRSIVIHHTTSIISLSQEHCHKSHHCHHINIIGALSYIASLS